MGLRPALGLFLFLLGAALIGTGLQRRERPVRIDPPAPVAGPNDRLLNAAYRGDCAGVEAAVADGADVNYVGYEVGVRYDYRQYAGTPLIMAARKGSVPVIELLLEHGAEVNLPNAGEQHALTVALESISDTTRRKRDYINSARRLIEAGANPNVSATWASSHEHYSALYLAVQTGDVGLVRLMVRHGANLDEADEDNRSLLGAAGANRMMVRVLIEHGADPNLECEWGEGTPLSRARAARQWEIVRMLKRAGARR